MIVSGNVNIERFFIMRRKNRKKNIVITILNTILVSLLSICAVAGGIYCAKIYTTPYSNEIVASFDDDTLHNVSIKKEKYNILITGTDKSGMLTDVLMLAQIDPVDNKAVVMSIPRDTWVKYRGRSSKITEVYSAFYNKKEKTGIEDTILAVRELTDVPIHHFVKVNTKAFRQCIDELGGVDFDVPQNMRYNDPAQDLYINLKKGQQHLDGDKAEQLVRFRHYPNGDIGRIEVQQKFLHALAEQKLKPKYVGKIDDIYSIVIKNIETSMSPDDFVECGSQLLEIGTENIETITLPHAFVNGASYVKPVPAEIANIRRNAFGYTVVKFKYDGKVSKVFLSSGKTLKKEDFPKAAEKEGYDIIWEPGAGTEIPTDTDMTITGTYVRKN